MNKITSLVFAAALTACSPSEPSRARWWNH